MSAERRLPPTPRRRAQARRAGRVARSRVLTAAASLVAGMLLVVFGGISLWGRVAAFTEESTRRAFADPDVLRAVQTGFDVLGALLLPFLIVVFGAVVISGVAQVGVIFTVRPLVPDAERIRPRRPGSRAALWDGVRGGLMLFGGAIALRIAARDVLIVSRETLPDAVRMLSEAVLSAATPLLALIAVIGVVDWLIVRARHERGLRMTPQEREEERRQTEGDTGMKSRLRVVSDGAGSGSPAESAERDPTTRVGAATGEVEARD